MHVEGSPTAFDPHILRATYAIESGINQPKHRRAVASRYDKLAVRDDATLHIVTIETWSRALTKVNS